MSTLIGIFLGTALLLLAVVLGSPDSWLPFFNAPAILIVFGGTIAAIMTAFPFKVFLNTSFYIKQCFSGGSLNAQAIAAEIVSLAEAARREGLLALESRTDILQDRFLAKSLMLVIDGLPPASVETIVRAYIDAINTRHQCGRNLMMNYAKYTPAFGMIGTLIGLVLMLSRLDAATVGPGMAVAVLTTLYGTVAANLFFLPLGEKLRQLNETEVRIREMTLQGVLAIQNGEHPRIIEIKLATFFEENKKQDRERNEVPLPEESSADIIPITDTERKAA